MTILLLTDTPNTPKPSMGETTKLVVSLSGGKDSTFMLLKVLEEYPASMVVCHHQLVVEDWPGTVEYCQELCDRLGVPLVVEQARYYGFVCTGTNNDSGEECKHRWLSAQPDKLDCDKCKRPDSGRQIAVVERLLDLMYWRQMWPSSGIRFCTSYLKRDLFNKWVRRNRVALGSRPVVVMGERWNESPGRKKLPYLKVRAGVGCEGFQMVEWRPILHCRRREVFRGIRAAGFEPHPCYRLQGMTDDDMYEKDEEGGPRMSCRCCIFNTPAQLRKAASIPDNEELFREVVQFEEQTGYHFRQGLSMADILAGNDAPEKKEVIQPPPGTGRKTIYLQQTMLQLEEVTNQL